ncbi:hypothetical protein N0V82_006040 [Gnomoniopsis sp. IMI 355080]|nr:hypothetical protein N0V82_006040 [Gnomoniopsis sp. IMI 355080]
MAPAVYPIQPAQLLKSERRASSAQYAMTRLRFKVPLQHDHIGPNDDYVELTAHMLYDDARSSNGTRPSEDWVTHMKNDNNGMHDLPIILYLCGGPGADNPPNRNPAMNQWLLEHGYSILYMDYRGCGESSTIYADALLHDLPRKEDQEIAKYLTHFCQDNIVRDLEAVRHCLSRERVIAGGFQIKWTILGQSYGGYISLTYLSTFPEGLQEVFITGGLPPCGMKIDEYFRIEYQDIVKQNKKFYATYPDSKDLVRNILTLINTIGPRNIKMTGRGYMNGQKLLTLGRQFGSKVGFPEVYNLLQRINYDLQHTSKLSMETIVQFESTLHVDERPLYPIFLEQTWCSGGKTRWAAERVACEIEGFEYLRQKDDGTYPDPAKTPSSTPIYFTANTYCRFHYDTHEELIDLKGAAEILADHEWECPYNYEMLANNPYKVPVYAVIFEKDMHLDVGVAATTAAMVGGLRLVVDPGWHQDIRYKPGEVLERLFIEKRAAEKEMEIEMKG